MLAYWQHPWKRWFGARVRHRRRRARVCLEVETVEARTLLSFQLPGPFPVGPSPLSPYAVVVADVNGDGKGDLVTLNKLSNTVNVLLGNGDGTFQPARSFAVGSEPVALAV